MLAYRVLINGQNFLVEREGRLVSGPDFDVPAGETIEPRIGDV